MWASRGKLLLVMAVVVALLVIWLRPADELAKRQVEAGLQRALVTFAVARSLNGVLSAVQSASINVGVGVSGSVNPGAILEPIDDLVEQFSVLVLAASISFAAQLLLLEISGAWPVSLAVTAALVLYLVLRWRSRSPPNWLPRLALFLLCLRLAVPVLAVGSELTYQLLLAGQYDRSQAEISRAELTEAPADAAEGLGERVRRWWAQSADVSQKVQAIKARADALVVHVVRLAAVFVVQTLVLPLFFLWLVVQLYRIVLGGSSPPFGRIPRRLTDEVHAPDPVR